MIKVFNATDKNYATHGDLILQPSKAVVHKEDNGEFYLDLETPLNEKEYKNTTPEEGQTAEGTSFSINVDTTKQYQVQTLKGQTTQSGTPTPSSPQPINITTGRQVVSVYGKNLANIDNIVIGKSWSNVANTNRATILFIPVEKNQQYSLVSSYTNQSITQIRGVLNKGPNDQVSSLVVNGTFKNDSNWTYMSIEVIANTTFTSSMLDGVKIMLCKGSATISDYEEYKGNDYEINLGKNLCETGTSFYGGSGQWYNQFGENMGTVSAIQSNTHYINLQPNTTYKFYIHEYNNISNVQVIYLDSTNTLKTYANYSISTNVATFTTTTYTKVWIRVKATASADNTYFIGQLEKGDATSYTPYKTPIYLGEMRNTNNVVIAKDYIFRNTTENPLYDSNLEEGQWYIHKEIGRVVLNGASGETWALTGTNPFYRYRYLDDALYLAEGNNIISNQFGYNFINATNENIGISISSTLELRMRETTMKTLADWKTWLSTHPLEVYYVLNTPTNTLIEDEELINQLNSIELLEGLNNVSVSSANLPAILQLKYNFTTAYSNVIKYIDYLVPNNILVANTPQGDQAFRITNIEKTRRKIKLKANHVFYDTMNYLIADSYVVDKNCNDALDHLNNATSDLSPFTTISNITSINSYRCVRKSLYEAIQVVLERWGGHLVRNNWTLGIYDTIGQDNGVTIRYAKNLKDISATYDWNEVITKLLPVGKDGLLLNEIDPDASIYVESATQYDIPYTKTVSFEQNNIVEDDYKDEEGTLDEDAYKQALVDDLYSKAMEYITNNYLPKVNYKLSANVEKVSDVGDRVEVIDEKLGINLMTNIISFDYDCILERYTQIEFGNFTPTLSNLMTQISVNTEEQINSSTQTLQITLNQELTDATDKIWNALGNSYVIYEGDKILVVDTLPKEEATNVIMINNGGIAFSNSGIDGTFSSAWTIDNVLNMEQINVINLTADLIKGGTLKLGSNLNQNGRLEVFDEANSLIAELNKDGLKMYGNDGSYVLMNNTVGFAGYDRNDNKIYWVDKDVFHQKKSEVEEEITLVKKMRIIPITIRDNNNQIVNDGIGFVNVGGGV